MNILLLSPYHGGSHQAWAEGYQKHSQHQVDLFTLPARFWKWRMHGGAITLARRFLAERAVPDVILATDMLDLTTFLSLTRPASSNIPVVLYMHENQLTYPLPGNPHIGPMRRQKGERDLHYVFINFASMLAADRILFNSQYHHDTLLAALPRFLNRFPEYNEKGSVRSLHEKSFVLPVGLDLRALASPAALSGQANAVPQERDRAPLILWNQRWEYDKNPEAFFRTLYRLQAEGIPFQLALCGESFARHPPEFEEGQSRLSREIVHVGYASPEEYHSLLWSADITISTAHHEFFGISILEAICCHTFPILPARLSYPELIPPKFHPLCLYKGDGELLRKLRWALQNPRQAAQHTRALAPTTYRFDWQQLAAQYDSYLGAL